jgi:RNA-binding protein
MELTSKQRSQLRGLANSIDTILQVGKDGIGDNLIKQADDAGGIGTGHPQRSGAGHRQ